MAKSTKNNEQNQIITIKPLKKIVTEFKIVGDSPLIVHAWGEKAKKQMLAAQQKEKPDKKAMNIRDPFSEFFHALYWITPKPEEDTEEAFTEAVRNGAKFGFPVIAIKQAALSAAYRAGMIPNQVGMKSCFFLNGVESGTNGDVELAVIDSEEPPRCQESMVRIGGISKVADLRYRPVFDKWAIRLKLTLIDVGTFTVESILNAIEMGGQMNGIGEWRMEKDGDFGRFHVSLND